MSIHRLHIEHFFDPATSTITYLVMDAGTHQAAIIDSVLDYDPKSGRTSTASADALLARVKALSARVEWIWETHVHADHFTAAPYLQEKLQKHPAKTGIGESVRVVQATFKKVFHVEASFRCDGSSFNQLFTDNQTFALGEIQVKVLHVPGHTPACSAFVFTDPATPESPACFVGDTLFMPDYGSARCDFPGGSAKTLFASIKKVLALPPATRLCHDYQPNGRPFMFQTTVAEMREKNIHIHEGVSEAEFVAMRTALDATLEMPVLILPAVQVNMRAGHFPPPEANGISYLKIPLNAL